MTEGRSVTMKGKRRPLKYVPQKGEGGKQEDGEAGVGRGEDEGEDDSMTIGSDDETHARDDGDVMGGPPRSPSPSRIIIGEVAAIRTAVGRKGGSGAKTKNARDRGSFRDPRGSASGSGGGISTGRYSFLASDSPLSSAQSRPETNT